MISYKVLPSRVVENEKAYLSLRSIRATACLTTANRLLADYSIGMAFIGLASSTEISSYD